MLENRNINLLELASLTSWVISAFFLPISTGLSNIGVLGIIITNFISFIVFGFKKKKSVVDWLFFSPVILFIPLIIGLIVTQNYDSALQEIFKSVFLFLVPISFFRKDISSRNYTEFTYWGILLGVTISSVILLFITIYRFVVIDTDILSFFGDNYLNNQFIAPFEELHPIYMGVYYLMGLSVLLFSNLSIPKIFKKSLFLLLSISILLLASRVIYLIYLILVLLYLIHFLSFKVFAVLITGVFSLIIFSYPYVKATTLYRKTIEGTFWEFENSENLKYSKNNIEIQSLRDIRLNRWQLGYQIYNQNLILGKGTGSEKNELSKLYKEYNFIKSLDEEKPINNQFLSFAIKFGTVGLILLGLYFIKNLIIAIKKQHLLFLSFLIILFWIFLTENMLDRNMGINFIALFGTLFFIENYTYHNYKIKNIV